MSWMTTLDLFRAARPGFEERPEQTKLAQAIESALDDGVQLLAEGPCGVGKSYAGLVPAIEWAQAHDRPVVVATATKALQTQYATSDLPTLAKIFADAGQPFRWTVLKGRGNYACAAKINDGDLTSAHVFNLASLREELATPGHTGDLGDLVTDIDWRQTGAITSSSDECPGRIECPFGEVCFAEQAKGRAQQAHIVVVNHALLIADAELRLRSAEGKGILPDYGALLIDEAHDMIDYATSVLGSEFTERSLARFGEDMAKFVGEDMARAALTRTTAALFMALEGHLGRNRRTPDNAKRLSMADMVELSDALLQVWEAANALREQVASVAVHGDDKKKITRKRLLVRAERLLGRIREVTTADSEALVRWVERDPKHGLVLKYAPLHVGPFLARHVWRDLPVVGMSATLSTGEGDFGYVARSLGMTDYRTLQVESPFDFAKHAGLFIPAARTASSPKGFADPSKDTALWRQQAQNAISALVQAAGGRALLLFASRAAMQECHGAVADILTEELGVRVLMQGELPNRQLSEIFASDQTSVLFALKSFMTGASFEGDAVRLVILDKVPFTSPTDVIFAARCEAADKAVAQKYGVAGSKATFHREGSFYGISIPAATLVAQQAAGRLIRTKDDEGLIAVLDPRIGQGGKGYGSKIRSALPPARKLASLAEARDYLAELAVRRG